MKNYTKYLSNSELRNLLGSIEMNEKDFSMNNLFYGNNTIKLDVSEVKQVIDLRDITLINEYLSLGWKLIFIGQSYSHCYDTMFDKVAYYHLGWFEEIEPKHPPKKDPYPDLDF